MAIKAKKKVLLCKVETTKGVDASPTEAADAIYALNVSINPLNVQYIDRNAAVPFFGHSGQINVGETLRIEFDVEMAGAGAVANVPIYGPCMIGCCMSETVTPTNGPVTYNVISDNEKTVTIYFWYEDQLHKVRGAFGSWEIRMSAPGVPLVHYAFEGIYVAKSTTTPSAPDLSAAQEGLGVTNANTTCTLHGYSAILEGLTITQGNVTPYRNRPGSNAMHFTDRQMTGSITLELPKIATKGFVEICKAGTLGTLAVVHGTVAGQKVLLDATNVQLTNPQYQETDNIVMLTMGMNFRYGASGNDEFTYKTQ